jgi:hypothetical protein
VDLGAGLGDRFHVAASRRDVARHVGDDGEGRHHHTEAEVCRTTGLLALKERNPSIKDVSLDLDSMTVAKANTKVEDTPIKTIVIGDAYLEKGKKETRRTFLCLIGEKGKVLLTFFTEK